MTIVLKRAILALVTLLAAAVAHSQTLVQQNVSISLTINSQVDTGIQKIHIGNKEIIAKMVGTNVPNGRLLLVMPYNPVPDSAANIGAFLRALDAHGNIVGETTTDSFNIYQDPSSRTGTKTVACDSFSFDIGNFGAEIEGQGTWTKSNNGSGGQGSFHCNVSGPCVIIGTTDGYQPCSGSITGGSVRLVRD